MAIIVAIISFIVLCHPTEALQHDNPPQHPQLRRFEELINGSIIGVVDTIAQYDPFNIERYIGNLFTHQFEVKNFNVEGFSNIFASHIKISGMMLMTVELTLELPKLRSSTEEWSYSGNSIYGRGAAGLELNNVQLCILAKIKPLELEIVQLDVGLVGAGEAFITGLYNNKDLSRNVTNLFNNFINKLLNTSLECSQDFRQLLSNLFKVFVSTAKSL